MAGISHDNYFNFYIIFWQMKIYVFFYWQNSDNFVWNFVFEQTSNSCVSVSDICSFILGIWEFNWSGIYFILLLFFIIYFWFDEKKKMKKCYGCDLNETKLFAFLLFLNDYTEAARYIDCVSLLSGSVLVEFHWIFLGSSYFDIRRDTVGVVMAALSHSDSNKKYSWWWDSHNSPKNSKWLQENLTGNAYSISGLSS
jgi:hypothetical protein